MANLTPTFGLQKANTTTFLVTGTAGDKILLAALVLGQPAGQLLTFLNGTYANAAAADLAFRAIGGRIAWRQTTGTAGTSTPVLTWTIAANAIADLDIAWTGLGAASTIEFTIETMWSGAA